MSELAWLDEIEARGNAATPGPWRLLYDDNSDWNQVRPVGTSLAICTLHNQMRRYNCLANGAFIAHAREDVPKLCQAVRDLHGHLQVLTLKVRDALNSDLEDCEWDNLRLQCELAEEALERWQRGGDEPGAQHANPGE